MKCILGGEQSVPSVLDYKVWHHFFSLPLQRSLVTSATCFHTTHTHSRILGNNSSESDGGGRSVSTRAFLLEDTPSLAANFCLLAGWGPCSEAWIVCLSANVIPTKCEEDDTPKVSPRHGKKFPSKIEKRTLFRPDRCPNQSLNPSNIRRLPSQNLGGSASPDPCNVN